MDIQPLKKRPDISREKLERTRVLMDRHATDALVNGYENLIPGLQLPDPDDRHVLAAAIRGRADVIVTLNRKDFPAEVLEPFGLEAQHPDDFIVHLFVLGPEAVIGAARTHARVLEIRLKRPQSISILLNDRGSRRPFRFSGGTCSERARSV